MATNNFDPTKFGATPVKSFDASKFGAKPLKKGFPTQEPESVKRSFMQKVGSSLVDPLKGGIQNVKQITSNVGKSFSDAGKQTVNDLSDSMQGKKSAIGAGFQAVGNFSKAVISPITETVEVGVNDISDKLSNNEGFKNFAISKVGDALSKANIPMDRYSKWSTAHPEAAKNLEALGNIFNLGTSIPASGQAGVFSKNALDSTGDFVKPKLNKIEAVGQKVLDKVKEKGDLNLQTKVNQQFDDLAGKITQGEFEDVPRAQRALSSIDTSKVKTYKDLESTLNSKIETISSRVDEGLNTRPEAINIKDLTTNNHNYVLDALDQLDDYYIKTNDILGQRNVRSLKSKANTQGLTIKEVNDLARIHGSELNGFNANGELASGLTRKAAENTRVGLKDTVRNYANDPVFKAADQQLSDLIRTKELISKVSERVTSLQQKIQQRGLGAKVGSLIARVFDVSTMGAGKGFVNYFIPRGEGIKLLNALDLEKGLEKSLKMLQKLESGALSEADMTFQLQQIIKEGSKQKLLPAPKTGTPKESINVPINQPSRIVTNSADEMNIPRSRIIKPKYKGRGKEQVTQIFGE